MSILAYDHSAKILLFEYLGYSVQGMDISETDQISECVLSAEGSLLPVELDNTIFPCVDM